MKLDLIGIFTKIRPVVKNIGKNQPTKLYWTGTKLTPRKKAVIKNIIGKNIR